MPIENNAGNKLSFSAIYFAGIRLRFIALDLSWINWTWTGFKGALLAFISKLTPGVVLAGVRWDKVDRSIILISSA